MAKKLNLVIDQGSDFVSSFAITGPDDASVDLSTYTGQSQFRKHATSMLFHSINVDLQANGVVELTMSSSETAEVEPGRYLYDVEITDALNNVTRILEGTVTVTPNITR